MNSFKDEPFDTRIDAMGDEAESVFESVFPGSFERTGFNRPTGVSMGKLPPPVRYLPDYIRDDAWYEVQGGAMEIAFKQEKMGALGRIQNLGHPVKFFLYSSKLSEYTVVDYFDVIKTIHDNPLARAKFPEGKIYAPLSVTLFAGWKPYVARVE